MKEITPYLYSILFKKRIQSYAKYKETFAKWTIGECDTIETPKPPQDPIEELVVDEAPSVPTTPIEYVICEEPAIPPTPLPKPVVHNVSTHTLPEQSKKVVDPSRFVPKKPDALFWSIFVGQYGPKEYFAIEHKYMNREIEEKTSIIQFLGKQPLSGLKHMLKSMRITTADLKEITGDLMIQKQANLMVIHAFVLYYKRAICIVHEETRSYFQIDYPGTLTDVEAMGLDLPILIYKIPGGAGGSARYTVDLEVDVVKIHTIIRDYIQIEKYNKAMKGASSYKSKDLETIVTKMKSGGGCIVLDPKQKKQDLYISIYRVLQQAWDIS